MPFKASLTMFGVLCVHLAPLLLLLLFFHGAILPHTFELLCSIVPWSWLGSLIPRSILLPGQLAYARPHWVLPAGGMSQRQGLQKRHPPPFIDTLTSKRTLLNLQ